MNARLVKDHEEIPYLLEAAKDVSISFLSAIDTMPVTKAIPAFPAAALPAAGMGGADTWAYFLKQYAPYLAANAGPRYWGFVTGGVTPAAITGDWLSTVVDMNAADKGGLSMHIETETIALLRSLFGLPATFNGFFVSGATLSNFTGLAIGRQWVGRQRGVDIGQSGLAAVGPIKVLSCAPHSSAVKALSMLGLGRDALVRIPALPNREAVDIAALKAYLEANEGPFIYIANAGTVNTVDFDDLTALVALKQTHPFWLHVDAAFGGFAACSDTHKHLLAGWEAADSITIDAHKWLNVPYDSAMIFCKHPDLQTAVFQNVGAAYLGNPATDFNVINYVPENSRRLRALPAWFSLMAYGAEGYRDIVENNVTLAQQLGERIAKSRHFKLLAPVRLCVVCFTLDVAVTAQAAAVSRFLEKLNAGGVVYMTATEYQGVPGIRAALVNWRTVEEDVILAFEEMEAVFETISIEA
jgi:glutamate/tyrosine decarboxylase-like PLP-dependent enzyme